MVHEKDTAFKYIGKEHRNVFFELTKLPKEIGLDDIQEVTEELGTLDIIKLRPDFIGKNKKAIIMYEYESSIVGTESKKRFLVYYALFNYLRNKENLDIYFIVLTTKEKTKIKTYSINDSIKFKIPIINIRDFGFEKTINNTKIKINKQETFQADELVKLALTSLMPETKNEIIQQFKKLNKYGKKIKFDSEKSKTSYYGLLLLLSNMYFDADDKIRKNIQRDFMNTVDCVKERFEEEYNAGYDEGEKIGYDNGEKDGREKGYNDGREKKIGIKLLNENFPIKKVSQLTDIPIEKLKKEYDKYKQNMKKQ